jgi:large subunit ribosomal protein L15
MVTMRKSRKERGSRSHGKGRGRSHNRGAGNRGGVGRAGSGKKGDAKKSLYWKDTKYFGKYGFIGLNKDAEVINVSSIQTRIEALVAAGAVKDGATVALNLTELGIDKLLGTGNISVPVTITVEAASASAIEKVTAAGGSVSCAATE